MGAPLEHPDTFVRRHIGPAPADISEMLAELGCATLDELADAVVPTDIRLVGALDLPPPLSESEALARLRALAGRNVVARSYLGMGYYGTITPPALRRNLLENPGWYTAYTPYQPEIAQGRLEALLNFQTMVCDLTAMEIANASLLDEATAAAEAMAMACNSARGDRATFVVAADCHPQTIAVVRTRAAPLGLRIVVAPPAAMDSITARWVVPALPGCVAAVLMRPPKQNKIEKAKNAYAIGLAIAKDNKITVKIAELKAKIGQVYTQSGNAQEAENYLENSVTVASKVNKTKEVEQKVKFADFQNTNRAYSKEIETRKQIIKDINSIEKDSIITNESPLTKQKQNYKIVKN